MKHFGILFVVATGLGACSSAIDYSSSISEQQVYRIGTPVTAPAERDRLIEVLSKIKRDHYANAIKEIAAR